MTALLFNRSFSKIITSPQKDQNKHTQLLQLILSFIHQSFNSLQQSAHALLDRIQQQKLDQYNEHIYQIKDANAQISYFVKVYHEYLSRSQQSQKQQYIKYLDKKVQKLDKQNRMQDLQKDVQTVLQNTDRNDLEQLVKELNRYDQNVPVYRTTHCIHSQFNQKFQDISHHEKELNRSIQTAIKRMIKSTIADLNEFIQSFSFEANKQFALIMSIIKNQYQKILIDNDTIPTIEQLNNMRQLCLSVKATIQSQKKKIQSQQEKYFKGQHSHYHQHTTQHHHHYRR